MLTKREAFSSILGALHLLMLDSKAVNFFDGSKGAALRSFWVLVILIPLGLVMTSISEQPFLAHYGISLVPYLACQLLASLIALPFGFALVWQAVKMEHLTEHYPRFVSAYNWFNLVTGIVFLPVFVLDQSGLLAYHERRSLGIAVYCLLLAYNWFMAWRMLKTNPFMAAGISILIPMVGVIFSDFVSLKFYGVSRPFEEAWFIALSGG